MKRFFTIALLMISADALAAPISVLSLNVWGLPGILVKKKKTRLKQICRLLQQRTAQGNAWDVVLIQEMWLMKDQRAFQNCGYRYVAAEDRRALDSGLLILSQFPIVDQFKIRYRVKNDVAMDAENFARKGALFALLMHPTDGLVWVVNTHLASMYKRHSNERARVKQLSQLTKVMMALDSRIPVIFGGDLNTGPGVAEDQAWRALPQLFPNFREWMAPTGACTSCADNPYSAKDPAGLIDHIFASGLDVVSGQVFKTKLSDHYGWETIMETRPTTPPMLTYAPNF